MKRIASRLGVAQAASGMVNGVSTPFFGAWLAWRGLTASQIATTLAAGLLLRIFIGPATGIIADARNDRRAVMLNLYWVAVAGYCVLTFVDATAATVAAAIAVLVANGVALPLLESVSVRLADRYGYQYGRVRLCASSSFVLFNIVGGICFWRFGTWVITPLLGLTSVLCIITTLYLPSPTSRQPRGDFLPGLRTTFGETRELLRSWPFLIFLIAASLAQGSHAFYYGYGGLHWRELGYSGVLIGVIWPLGVFAEIMLFMFAQRVVNVLKPAQLLFWAGAACALRWTILAFDPPLAIVVLAQFMHGATFPLSHLGAMFFIKHAVPHRLAATAQSLYFVCYSGLVLGIATYASGMIYASYGGLAYLVMSAMGLAAMGLAALLARIWDGKHILQSGSEEHIDTI